MKKKTEIETKNNLFGLYKYPVAKEIMEKQQDIFWTAQEIPIENDINDYKIKMNVYQYNLTTITLDTFVEIEQSVGEVWEEIARWFPHSEIQGACSFISAMEKSVHAFFYQKMSDTLNRDPEDILLNQSKIKPLKEKLEFIKFITKNMSKDKLLSLFTVSMIEQTLLFSNFAMLKSFQANGNNLIKNTITGVDFVQNDENIHGVFASYLYTQLKKEMQDAGIEYDYDKHYQDLLLLKDEIIEHEHAVIDHAFGGTDKINDITPYQLKQFVLERVNTVFIEMGYNPPCKVDDTSISDWFFMSVKSITLHDFFTSNTNQYRRGWSLDKFSLLQHI